MPIVCTYSYFITEARHFLQDGLCDFAFYDSIAHRGVNMLGDSHTDYLQRFLSGISNFQKTGAGVSISAEWVYLDIFR